MRLGRPEQFQDKFTLRMQSIQRAVAQFEFSAAALRKPLEARLDEHTTFYLKGFGNEVNLLAATRELLFPSRELLDAYLGKISAATAASGTQTSRDFVPFLKRLLAGDYDKFNKPIFGFLKDNVRCIFLIRKLRNQIKSDPSSAEFSFNTDHFELKMSLPLKAEDEATLPHLELSDLDEILRNREFPLTMNMDAYFPEMVQFWSEFKSVYEESFGTERPDDSSPQSTTQTIDPGLAS